MTVAELLARISSQELTEWVAFYVMEAKDMEAAQKKASRGSRRR